MFTTYQYASNRPIDGIDLDGQEFLPYQKSMYRLEYKVKTPITNASIIVKTVYENIPGPLQDAKNRSFKYVGYGPVTAFGRDWNVSIDGPTIYEEGKYYNKGPNIYGTAEGGKSTQGINSIKGNATQNTLPTAQNINGVGGAVGENGAGGISSNQLNKKIWYALGDEYDLRQGFYNATNLVGNAFKENVIGDKTLLNQEGRVSLINFISDGTLPISNSEYQLSVAYTGVQLMQREGMKIRKETKASIQDLLKKYKADGGGKKYDDINKFISSK